MKKTDKTDRAGLAGQIISVVSILIITALIAIVLIGDGYSYLCEDDFSFESGVKTGIAMHGNAFRGAIRSTIDYCKMWQGTYLSVFLYFFIGPYGRFGIQGYHLSMIILSLLFIFGLYFLVSSFITDKICRRAVFALGLLSAFQMRGSSLNQELFLWYSGALNYTLVLSLSMIAAGAYIRAFRSSEPLMQRNMLILSSVIGFAASLGCLEITAFNCACLLAVLVYNYPYVKENKKTVIPFVLAFIAALSNVLSPGNFSKSNMWTSESHTSAFDALVDTVKCYGYEFKIIMGPVFILILVLCFAAGMYFRVQTDHNGMKTGKMILSVIVTVGVQMITIFPVLFGYHSANLSSARTQATYEIIGRLMFMFLAFSLAQFVNEQTKEGRLIPGGVIIAAGLILMLVFAGTVAEDTRNGYEYMLAADLHEGKLQENYAAREYVLNAMETAPKGSDVYVELPMSMIITRTMYGMG
ncbi:MAG: hypothetical protein IK123_03565, partial [Lachnospiraceae bacterium]|nr:hypothetical protein [Lachnospiraceae bacterium]